MRFIAGSTVFSEPNNNSMQNKIENAMPLAFDHNNPFPSRRSATYASHGMVAASQPQASQAGRDILAQGGNAIDAAIATAAVLTVVEPSGNGIGGDAFALVWRAEDTKGRGRLHGLNASGHAPKCLTPEAVRAAGHGEMPLHGWTPVTVPGIPAAWAELSRQYGRLDFAALLAPAIRIAREGFPVSPVISQLWQRAEKEFRARADDPAIAPWLENFAPEGHAPQPGEMYCNEALATTLEALAESHCESFYRGDLAQRIDAFSRETGGYLRADDLADYQPEWVEPISVNYRGFDVWEIPPNGQGMVALMALQMMEGFDITVRDDPQLLHRQLEAMKLAYTDGHYHITHAEHMRTSVASLLSDAYADTRRRLIGERAIDPEPGEPQAGGTVYLATADRDGNMVSYIQSNYHGFGSGVVVPDTGISLQNRGHGFSLEADHVNVLAPGKRTFHTIIPGFLTQGDTALGPFGVMGGFMQPQGHMQVVMNLVDFGLNPQAALDAPRWQWMGGRKIGIEPGYPMHVIREMGERGHQMTMAVDSTAYGRGQIILRDPQSGVYCGGTEPRTDSSIAVL